MLGLVVWPPSSTGPSRSCLLPTLACRYKESNGFNSTGGGFPWNHWGVGQPSTWDTDACVAADKSMTFYRYDSTDLTIRVQDTAQNIWGWNDLACSTPLPIICAVSCEHPQVPVAAGALP